MTLAPPPAAYLESLFSLEGQLAVVTGASRGIGLAIAQSLASAGADIIAVSHAMPSGDSPARAAVESLGRTFTPLAADLSDASDVAALAAGLASRPVDILVNNAGTIRRTPAAEHSDEDWDHVLGVNLRATFTLSREIGRGMIERGAREDREHRVDAQLPGRDHRARVHGVQVGRRRADQGARQRVGRARGQRQRRRSRLHRHREHPRPAATTPSAATPILARIPAGRWAEPADIAGAVVFLCSRAADYIHGTVLPVDGGWLAR